MGPGTFVLGAHPRSRGEHLFVRGGAVRKRGSSPLTRGAQKVLIENTDDWRLIPAHAGSTADYARRLGARAAHPRSRGEHTC